MRLVIVPCKDEQDTIRQTLLQLRGERVLVVDNGSDNSADIAREMGVEVVRSRGEKYGDAILTGLEREADQYVVMDCESHTFSDIVPFLDCGADIIAGLRKGEKKPWYRKVLTRIGREMKPDVNIKITDISNGFRAYSRKFRDHLLTRKKLPEAPSYAFNAAVAFETEDWSVQEFPMTYKGGRSGMTASELLKAWNWRSSYEVEKEIPEATFEDLVAYVRMNNPHAFDAFIRRRHK